MKKINFENSFSQDLYKIYYPEMPVFMKKAIQSDALQRINLIDMNCGMIYTSFPFFQNIEPFSRLQHSIGVGLLAYRFTNEIPQAFAGLFHDIATPAFSHVVDFMNGDHVRQESTEAFTSKIISNSDCLMSVISEYGCSLEEVDDYHKYEICDNNSPLLSCDRLEYTLSNALNYHFCGVPHIKMWITSMEVGENEFGQQELIFNDYDAAKSFAATALKCSKIYSSDIDRFGMEYLALILKEAIQKNIIKYDDLYENDEYIIMRIKKSELGAKWHEFTCFNDVLCNRSNSDGKGLKINAKKRYIDPYIKNMGRLSNLDLKFAQNIQEYLDFKYDYYIKGVVSND